jgi:hypothetical protein
MPTDDRVELLNDFELLLSQHQLDSRYPKNTWATNGLKKAGDRNYWYCDDNPGYGHDYNAGTTLF